MIEPREGWVDTGEVKLHYLDWPGKGPTILCIPGLQSNGYQWLAIADEIGGRHRVIAVTLRGRGLSDKPPAGSYGIPAHARDVAALIGKLGVGPVVAMGWSMGAFVVSLLAADYPDLVSHAVLVDGGGALPTQNVEQVRKDGAVLLQSLSTVFPSLEAYLDSNRHAGVWEWSEIVERYLASDMEVRPDGSAVRRASLTAIEEDFQNGVAQWRVGEVMPRVKAPTLAFWAPLGALDPAQPTFPRPAIEEVIRHLPNGRMVTIEGATHLTIGFSPAHVKKLVAAMDDFLAKS